MCGALGFVLLSILITVVPENVLSRQQQPELQTWSLQEPNTTKLGPAESVDTFSIRPPKGYVAQTRPGPRGSKMTAWVGPQRSDGTSPQLMVLTLQLQPDEMANYKLEQTLEELVGALSVERKNWKRTATEKGMINGLLFARTRWQGDDVAIGLAMRGFVYVAIAGNKLIQISSQDVEPHYERALRLAESSALTFETANPKG